MKKAIYISITIVIVAIGYMAFLFMTDAWVIDNCSHVGYKNNINTDTISAWNKENSIEIWSFLSDYDPINDIDFNTIEGGKVHISHPAEKVVLSTQKIETLKDLLYGYELSEKGGEGYMNDCFNPHHIILFFDKNHVPIAFIKICFECERTKSQNLYHYDSACSGFYKRMTHFFKKCGITKYLTIGEVYEE